jgi:hypothetical protein
MLLDLKRLSASLPKRHINGYAFLRFYFTVWQRLIRSIAVRTIWRQVYRLALLGQY